MSVIEIITSIFVITGALLIFVSSIGVLRLRDVYSRMHSAGKTSTLGVMFLMLGVLIYFIPEGFNAKILLAILFVFMTAPLSALMVNRSAYRSDVPLEKNSIRDELKEDIENGKV